MKRIAVWMLAVLCILSMAACNQTDDHNGDERIGEDSVKTYNDTEWLNEDPYISDLDTKDFEVQYIRAGIKAEDYIYPAARIFRTEEELKDYLENETYRSEDLLNACAKYNAEYFEERILVAVLLEEGSGSIRHEVERIGIESGDLWVEIKSIVPEAGTCDMAWWHVFIEPEAGVDVRSEENVTIFLDGVNTTEKHTVASHSKGFANISVTLKDGWEYDVVDEPNSVEFSINIYPAGQSQNKLRIAYYNGFGVCGTGLKQETVMIGRYEGWMGTYDNQSVWDYISLQGLPGDYVILNEGGEKWWSEYGEDAMQILATLKVADGFINSSDAIKIARDKLQSEYDEVTTSFNTQKGIWTVYMSRRENFNTYNMTVTMDAYGNIEEMYNPDEIVCAEKPVIYLYPTEETKVTVKLNLDGELTCTYPVYNDGWTVTASPDGTLIDENGREYYCLYWEGETYAEYDFSRGFCVKGEDTAAFLEDVLAKIGLAEREANEFIIYWLPQMELNAYNLISFQTDAYTDSAELEITPNPDSLLRVFMACKPLNEAVVIEPQEFVGFERIGFTVIEWGGAMVK